MNCFYKLNQIIYNFIRFTLSKNGESNFNYEQQALASTMAYNSNGILQHHSTKAYNNSNRKIINNNSIQQQHIKIHTTIAFNNILPHQHAQLLRQQQHTTK
ncbi:hypothetical protein ACTA71_012449 [Dictyostelium dimigraforme]